MKILFLHPPWPGKGYGLRSQNRWPRKRGDKTNRYPIYLCYTATLLKNSGFEVKFMDSVIQDFDEEQTLKKVSEFNPKIVFIETATPTFNYDKYFISQLKKQLLDIKVLVAGSHVTAHPESIKDSDIDIIIKGEQDYTTLNVVKALKDNKPLDEIKGICFKNDGKVINNEMATLITDLDSLPFPDRDLIPHEWYIEGHARELPFTFILASRGCPQQCRYCLWPNVYFNHRVRFRSPKNVVDELEWLIDKYGMKEVFFDDGTFNTTRKRVIDICKEIVGRNIKILWSCSARVDKVDEEMLVWMKKAGCKLICYGGESANQRTLDMVKKGIKVEQIKRAVDLTRKAKIITHMNFMLGFPWETKEEMENTIKLAIKSNPDTVQFSLVFPHPGSEYYYEAIEKDLFYDDIIGNWERFDMTTGPVLKTEHISSDDLVNAVSSAHARFFLRPTYIISQLLKINSWKELKRTYRGALSVIKGKILFRGKK